MNKTLNIQILAFTVGFIGLTNTVWSQNSENKADSLSSETVVIVREFEPVIKNAKKINHQPVIDQVAKKSPNFTYDLIPQNQEYNFNPDTIDAVKIKGEPLNKLYRAYVKAGMGNYLNNYGQLHINSLRSRDFQWGLNVHHLGSNGGVENKWDSYLSKQNVDLSAKKMLKHHAINAGFVFDREQINKYGINRNILDAPVLDIYSNSQKQTYIMYKGSAGVQSFISDSNELNYIINANYYNLTLKPHSTAENNILITSKFSKYFGTETGYLYFDVDYNKAKADSIDYKGNILIKPSIDIEFNGDKWHLLAGFKTAFEKGDQTRFYFFPNAEFKFNVVRNLIVPYIGITGGAKRNSFNSLRNENPYLYEYSELKTSRTSYDAYAGVRGLISSNLSYNVSAGYKQVKDMVLYTSDGTVNNIPSNYYYENVYQPVYDTVDVTHISTQIGYQRDEKWNVLWRMNYNNYQTKREAKAWNLPDFTSDLTLRYNLQDKIVAKSSMTFMSSKYVKTTEVIGTEEVAYQVYGRKIDPLFDFNVGIEYRFTKKVSAFVDVNNILSQNYEIWGNYQVQGINVLGGVTIAFWAK
jgi:hypothetical protein